MFESVKNQPAITGSRNTTVGFWSFLFFLFIALDWSTKYLAHRFHRPIFYNQNFAFSLPLPVTVMYLVYGLVLTVASIYLLKSFRAITNRERLAWVMIIASGLSNVLERLMRGSVTDFIFIWTGVFNLADFFIILGLLVLFLHQRR